VLALQSLVTRRIDAFDPAVVSVTRIVAGTAHNVIPESVQVLGTVRTFSERTRERVHAGLTQVAEGVAGAHGVRAKAHLLRGYPVTRNDAGFTAFACDVVREVVGAGELVAMPAPLMGAEDFSYVLDRVPGAMVFLGVRAPGERAEPLHSNRMQIDESAMATGIALHAAMALRYLEGAAA
jgi:hippurate hydrolase